MKKISLKGWIRKNEDLFRKIIRALRGDKCELQDCQSPYELQVDHCFSRNVKELYYDLSNLTLLCGSCHTKKSFNMEDFYLKVFEHVEAREGFKKFMEMRGISKKKGGFRDWHLISYQEEINKAFTYLLNRINQETRRNEMKKIILAVLIFGLINQTAFAMARKPTGDFNNPQAQRINACYGAAAADCMAKGFAEGITGLDMWKKDGYLAKCQAEKCI